MDGAYVSDVSHTTGTHAANASDFLVYRMGRACANANRRGHAVPQFSVAAARTPSSMRARNFQCDIKKLRRCTCRILQRAVVLLVAPQCSLALATTQ